MTKIAGSGFRIRIRIRTRIGSVCQRHGSADPDPDPHHNVMDPQHMPGSYSFFIRNSKWNLFRIHPDSLNSVPDHYACRILPRTGSKTIIKPDDFFLQVELHKWKLTFHGTLTDPFPQLPPPPPPTGYNTYQLLPQVTILTSSSHRLPYHTYQLLPQVTILTSSSHRILYLLAPPTGYLPTPPTGYLPAPHTGYHTYQLLPQDTVSS